MRFPNFVVASLVHTSRSWHGTVHISYEFVPHCYVLDVKAFPDAQSLTRDAAAESLVVDCDYPTLSHGLGGSDARWSRLVLEQLVGFVAHGAAPPLRYRLSPHLALWNQSEYHHTRYHVKPTSSLVVRQSSSRKN